MLINSISGLFMNELFISLKKEIYDRLDDSLDISDDSLYEVIDECIYEAVAASRLSLSQRDCIILSKSWIYCRSLLRMMT